MKPSVPNGARRMPAESLRTDSRPSADLRTDGLPVRTGSQPLRIDAKAEFLAVINETRVHLGKSIEAMAIDADCPLSSMSDALAGKEGRNYAGHWLIAQGDEFIETFNRIREERRGVTLAAKKARRAKAIAALVQLAIEEAS
jgi:hypothetical protein